MSNKITASMLYDLVQCPHRVSMDTFGDLSIRDEVNPFVQLLWDRGFLFEKEVISNLKVPYLDLSSFSGDEKERRTREAMTIGQSLIYSGRICAEDLLGEPDLLRKDGTGYIAGDIKSGSGEEGGSDYEDGKPKKHYAVQLGIYTDILEKVGSSTARLAFVWDIHGREVTYDFSSSYGPRTPGTLWESYTKALTEARAIIGSRFETLPAYSGVCKLCVWYSACLKRLETTNDLTLIPDLGRTKRDVMIGRISTIRDFAAANPTVFFDGKKTIFHGIRSGVLEKLHDRAILISADKPVPYLRESVTLPPSKRELFFDIEVDPMRDICYLHGFVERLDGDKSTERFIYFFADEPYAEQEEKAFAEAWSFMRASTDAMIYYYSKYERTIYRDLRKKYPSVCSEADIENLFAPTRAVDLFFDIVKKATEWPTRDHSIKTLACYLGFDWRDPHPSGAASIEWFHRWVETRDPLIKQRILEYNEDDCRATRVLLDGIRELKLK